MSDEREDAYKVKECETRISLASRVKRSNLVIRSLAVLSLLILGGGVYAVSDFVHDLVRENDGVGSGQSLETTDFGQSPSSSEVVQNIMKSYVPNGGKELNVTKTFGSVQVTLLRAYADTDSVTVGYIVEDLASERSVADFPADLQPVNFEGVNLTDESDTPYKLVSAQGAVSSGQEVVTKKPKENVAVFETKDAINPASEHRFRVEISISEVPVTEPGKTDQAPSARKVGQSGELDFVVPVMSTKEKRITVNQEVDAGGINLTLARVDISPAQSEAELCLQAGDNVSNWMPHGGDLLSAPFASIAHNNDCLTVPLSTKLNGKSQVVVDSIELNPFCPSCVSEGQMVRGPWRFDFTVPDS